jgi:hypothetical protein
VTVVEVARRILDKDWKEIPEVDIRTLGLALSMVEVINKSK